MHGNSSSSGGATRPHPTPSRATLNRVTMREPTTGHPYYSKPLDMENEKLATERLVRDEKNVAEIRTL